MALGRLGALVRGELDRPLPRRARGDAACSSARGIGGALVFVATKNVMSPGKDFAAYSAAKAAEAQLAKVLALEGAPHGIRSNIVNPDAVFQDSKLWSEEIRRERAAAQGIAVEQLEDFYRKRNLLGVAHPARGRGRGRAVPGLRPLGQDDGLHADGGRRRQGRVPAVTPDRLRRLAVAPSAGRAVRAGPARGGPRLRLGVDAATTCPSTTRSTSRSPCWRPTCRSPAGSSSAPPSTCWPSGRRRSRPRSRPRSTRCRAAG